MEDIEMTIDLISRMAYQELFSGNGDQTFDYISEEDYQRFEAIDRLLDNVVELDDEMRRYVQNNISCALLFASSNCFDAGLKLGLNMLKCLLHAEVPEIHVIHKPAQVTPKRRCTPISKDGDFEEEFKKFITDSSPYLTELQMIKLAGKIEGMMDRNAEKEHPIF